ncbi:MAG: hypothetical protein ACJAY8_001084 [Sphingobacteriales bacterium]|jgi:hypothetical protein
MGPNALPIPLPTAIAKRPLGISVGNSTAYNKSEYANATYFALNVAPFSDRVRIEFYGMPFEFFKVSHQLKTDRKTFWRKYNSKFANGDLQLTSYFNLLEEKFNRPSFELRINYRFPTSDNVGAARFTDSPGYFFDVSIEKTEINKHLKDKNLKKWFINLGFYAWQTNDARQFQNDAVVFGLGQKWENDKRRFSIYANGFIGYQNNGDQPIISGMEYQRNNWRINLERGLHDYNFTSLKVEKLFVSAAFFNTFRNEIKKRRSIQVIERKNVK